MFWSFISRHSKSSQVSESAKGGKVLGYYFLQAIDPIHPGAGGYNLGRVDNSVIRDPATGLPKIPGTEVHGADRHYAADLFAEHPNVTVRIGASQSPFSQRKACAGQGGHCGKCPICYTFGYTQPNGNN